MFLVISDPPIFKTWNYTVKQRCGEQNVEIHLGLTPLPFPTPCKIRMEKIGQRIQQSDSIAVVNDSILLFDEITVDHAGRYCLTATNYRLDNSSREVGIGKSYFTLDVMCKCEQ